MAVFYKKIPAQDSDVLKQISSIACQHIVLSKAITKKQSSQKFPL
jgi:hypothetical protein